MKYEKNEKNTSKENDILLVEGEILSVENSGLHIIGKLRKIEKT